MNRCSDFIFAQHTQQNIYSCGLLRYYYVFLLTSVSLYRRHKVKKKLQKLEDVIQKNADGLSHVLAQ